VTVTIGYNQLNTGTSSKLLRKW